jgi:hypothetical protein
MFELFTNKYLFTGIICFLYLMNAIVHVVLKEPLWAGYWFSAVSITFFTMLINNQN